MQKMTLPRTHVRPTPRHRLREALGHVQTTAPAARRERVGQRPRVVRPRCWCMRGNGLHSSSVTRAPRQRGKRPPAAGPPPAPLLSTPPPPPNQRLPPPVPTQPSPRAVVQLLGSFSPGVRKHLAAAPAPSHLRKWTPRRSQTHRPLDVTCPHMCPLSVQSLARLGNNMQGRTARPPQS